jgi:hypothetical protein
MKGKTRMHIGTMIEHNGLDLALAIVLEAIQQHLRRSSLTAAHRPPHGLPFEKP